MSPNGLTQSTRETWRVEILNDYGDEPRWDIFATLELAREDDPEIFAKEHLGYWRNKFPSRKFRVVQRLERIQTLPRDW